MRPDESKRRKPAPRDGPRTLVRFPLATVNVFCNCIESLTMMPGVISRQSRSQKHDAIAMECPALVSGQRHLDIPRPPRLEAFSIPYWIPDKLSTGQSKKQEFG